MFKKEEKITADSFVFPICNNCKNHIDGLKCKAFDEIPDVIFDGENDHSKPLPYQENNVIFEPINKD